MKIIIPERNDKLLYWQHWIFLDNLFKEIADVSYSPRDSFVYTMDGKDVDFDIWDSSAMMVKSKLPIFKMHTTTSTASQVHPFTPISFNNWQEYRDISAMNLYNPTDTKQISNRQVAFANALARRQGARARLLKHLGAKVSLGQLEQRAFFMDIANIKAAVCVPGFCGNMLDRGQLQMMALGVCTISPNIPEILPFGLRLIPGRHYIRCDDSYSDLLSIIDLLKPDECRHIGNNAKWLFNETCSPDAIKIWLEKTL